MEEEKQSFEIKNEGQNKLIWWGKIDTPEKAKHLVSNFSIWLLAISYFNLILLVIAHFFTVLGVDILVALTVDTLTFFVLAYLIRKNPSRIALCATLLFLVIGLAEKLVSGSSGFIQIILLWVGIRATVGGFRLHKLWSESLKQKVVLSKKFISMVIFGIVVCISYLIYLYIVIPEAQIESEPDFEKQSAIVFTIG